MAGEYQDPEYWLNRLIQRLMNRQARYQINEDYAVGNHPAPNGDPRYVKALKEFQKKARTNYVGLANKAASDICRRGFKVGDGGAADKDAEAYWAASNMAIQGPIAISRAAELGDVYGMVSPPQKPGGKPTITIEDPRICITEPDPLDPLSSIIGLKFYDDFLQDRLVAILSFPEVVYTYYGPSRQDFLSREHQLSSKNIVTSVGGFELISAVANPLGRCPLVRGAWQPEHGIRGMAECEDGGFDVQDRINMTVLQRIVVANSQAYRQRWATGVTQPRPAKGKRGGPLSPSPFQPGSDMVWAVASEKAKFGDFDQVDLKQLLEATRDDVGDFAALTRTPVTYLTNKMVNVSGDTLIAAQIGLITKKRTRMAAMGWFFGELIKLCFLYEGDERGTQEVQTLWESPEQHTVAEIADYVAKMTAAGIPLALVLERVGFSPTEIEFAVTEAEKAKADEEAKARQAVADQITVTKAGAAAKATQTNSSGGK